MTQLRMFFFSFSNSLSGLNLFLTSHFIILIFFFSSIAIFLRKFFYFIFKIRDLYRIKKQLNNNCKQNNKKIKFVDE